MRRLCHGAGPESDELGSATVSWSKSESCSKSRSKRSQPTANSIPDYGSTALAARLEYSYAGLGPRWISRGAVWGGRRPYARVDRRFDHGGFSLRRYQCSDPNRTAEG